MMIVEKVYFHQVLIKSSSGQLVSLNKVFSKKISLSKVKRSTLIYDIKWKHHLTLSLKALSVKRIQNHWMFPIKNINVFNFNSFSYMNFSKTPLF